MHTSSCNQNPTNRHSDEIDQESSYGRCRLDADGNDPPFDVRLLQNPLLHEKKTELQRRNVITEVDVQKLRAAIETISAASPLKVAHYNEVLTPTLFAHQPELARLRHAAENLAHTTTTEQFLRNFRYIDRRTFDEDWETFLKILEEIHQTDLAIAETTKQSVDYLSKLANEICLPPTIEVSVHGRPRSADSVAYRGAQESGGEIMRIRSRPASTRTSSRR